MPENIPSDEALLAAYRAGDNTALETLLKRYLKPIQAYFRKHGRAKDEPSLEQHSQDVFLAILEGLHNDRFTDTAPASFARWVYTICRNICINENRKSTQAKPFTTVYPDGRQPDPLGVLDRLGDALPDYTQQFAQTNDVMDKLSPKDQKLLRLRIVENKSYEEIQLDEDFKEYSIDYLTKMMYKIRNKINKIKETLYGKKE